MPKKTGFTLVEVLIAVAIFTIIMALVLAAVVGMFNSLRKAQKVIDKEQKQRYFLSRLSKEVSSFTRIRYPAMRFKGDAAQFFFVFSREDSLVESGYVCNGEARTLEHYVQEPADYDWNTRPQKEIALSNISSCGFSYSDGENWQPTWEETRPQFPQAVKINFKFNDETSEREFIVTIPVSQ
jgi:prepilin-type N-terminal cleavage/methylation domain-containing protein